MPYLNNFSIKSGKSQPFPFNVPAVRWASNISVDAPVTILVGDNGCGKSTILETIGLSLNLPLIGGGLVANHPGFEAARTLAPLLQMQWKKQVKKGFLFRAEDFSDFLNAVKVEQNKINQDLSDLQGQVDQSVIRQMSESMNYRLRLMRQEYGEDMQAFSHGEAFLQILRTRISTKGFYLLDEPEAALSPLKQLSLLAFLMSALSGNESQFIIATHSPIIMGLPGSKIYQITEEGFEQIAYKETEHFSITKNFLDNPQSFLRYL